ncbi:uncharacterized protein CPUR_03074 [Claviceps purpurea 20.1]|uniref:F-box domain-containing protein n=1 Tax=Claviceps purpurea (strain 20.1) TaxID=1111077 RepID=M1W0F9_CLAP2|nr:uncharacterized protein CPUR_03074 [Claviceps purpurea 20.1]
MTIDDGIKGHEQALKLFTRAMNSCPCAKGVERRKCTCKNFEKIAAEGGSIFREALYTCHCDVGRTFSKCDNVYHMEALDLQISTFEALGKIDHAMNNAEWMLELAPRLPDGYLRLGNIARRQKKDEFAWKVYTAGIEANEETALDSSPKLQQLYVAREPLNQRLFRQDPLCLPAELVTRIFLLLDFTDLPVCLRVCKKWARILTSPLHDMEPTQSLRHVIIQSNPETAVDLPGGFPQTFLENTAGSLEHLAVAGIPRQLPNELLPNIPHLPNVKTLRIGYNYRRYNLLPLPIFSLFKAFPKFEQLWLGPYVPYLDPNPTVDWQHSRDAMWPNLKVLIFKPCTDTISATNARDSLSTLRLLIGLKSVQYVCLEVEDWGNWPRIFSGSNDVIPDLNLTPYSKFQNLRVVESQISISPEGAQTLLSKAIASEQLTSFSIFFPKGRLTGGNVEANVDYLKRYEWFSGAPSIHTLGCYDFRFERCPENDEDLALPQFLATFPNLRTLSIDSYHYNNDDFESLLVAILRVTHLKTIHLRLGVIGDQLSQMMQAKGVQFVKGYPPMFGYKPQWPLPLKD